MGVLDTTVELAKSGIKKAEELATSASHALTSTISEQYAALTKSNVTKEVKSVTSDLARLSIAFDEPAETAKLTQKSANTWQTADKRLTIEHVDAVCGKNTACDSTWAKYDKQIASNLNPEGTTKKEKSPAFVDMDSLFNADGSINLASCGDKPKSDKCESPQVKAHDYINNAGERVTVQAGNGTVEYKATRNGEVVTSALQTDTMSRLVHQGDIATLEFKGNKLTVENSQARLFQEGKLATLTFSDGSMIKRTEDGQKLQVFAPGDQRLLGTVENNALRVGKLEMYDSEADIAAELSRRPGTNNGESRLLIAKDGTATLILPNGTVAQRRKDGSVVIHTAEHNIAVTPDGQAFIEDGDRLVPLAEWKPTGRATKATDGTVTTGGVKVTTDGKVNTDDHEIDVPANTVIVRDGGRQVARVLFTTKTVQPADGSPPRTVSGYEVQTADAGYTAQQDRPDITIRDNKTNTVFTANVKEPRIGNDFASMGSHDARLKHPDQPDRPDTIIGDDNTVTFGKDGPRMFGDGSMNLDNMTRITGDGFVESGSWTASRDGGSSSSLSLAADGRTLSATAEARLVATVQNVSQTAQSAAAAVLSKARSGHLTAADLGQLNQSIAEISGMLGQVQQMGGGALSSELESALGDLGRTVSLVVPELARTA